MLIELDKFTPFKGETPWSLIHGENGKIEGKRKRLDNFELLVFFSSNPSFIDVRILDLSCQHTIWRVLDSVLFIDINKKLKELGLKYKISNLELYSQSTGAPVKRHVKTISFTHNRPSKYEEGNSNESHL